MTHSSTELTCEIVAALRSRAPTLGAGRLLAVDGPAGSGKTTLANDVTERLRQQVGSVAVVRLDDLYDGWTGLDDSLAPRVLEQVVEPLARGAATRWQVYSWLRGRFTVWRDLAPPEVLVLEGCGAGALPYAPYTTLLVWVETPREIRDARAVARDGTAVLEHWPDWTRSEQRYFDANATKVRADIHVKT